MFPFAALFLTVMAAVLIAGYVWTSRSVEAADAAGVGATQQPNTVAGALQWVGERAPDPNRRKAGSTDPLRRRLLAAGYRGLSASSVFHGIRYVTAFALAIGGFVAANLFGGDALLGSIAVGALGYVLPEQVLKSMAERRLRRIRSGLPPAIDLLVLSLEAGQSLDMALMESARGLRASFPDIAAEITLLTGDLRANMSRSAALKAFHERTGEPELRKLSNLLADTDRFGTSLGPALRNHAKYLRTRMRQQVQESARKVGVKLIFPVFFLIFPSVILVTLGPAVIMVVKQMKVLMK